MRREREVDQDLVWYEDDFTVIFRGQWAVDLDIGGVPDNPPYQV